MCVVSYLMYFEGGGEEFLPSKTYIHQKFLFG